MLIKVATDFSETPAGRLIEDGPYSGQAFREKILVPALRDHDEVIVDLDGVEGFGSSFLEESFGGLAREEKFSSDELLQKLQFITSDPALEDEIRGYISASSTAK